MLQSALMRRTSSVLPDPGAPSKSTSSDRPCTPRAAISFEEVENSWQQEARGEAAPPPAGLREQDTGGARGSAKANLESYRDDHISRQPRLTLAIAYGKLSSIVFLFVTNHPAFYDLFSWALMGRWSM